jgi:hypothetical protein
MAFSGVPCETSRTRFYEEKKTANRFPAARSIEGIKPKRIPAAADEIQVMDLSSRFDLTPRVIYPIVQYEKKSIPTRRFFQWGYLVIQQGKKKKKRNRQMAGLP